MGHANSSRSRILRAVEKVFLPPRDFAGLSWGLDELELLAGFRGFGLDDAEMVVVEDAEGFDHVGGGDPAIADEEKVLAVGGVSGAGEVEGAEVNAGGGLVKVDNNELVMHECAIAPRSFSLEGLGQVLFQGGRADDGDRTVGLGEFQAFYAGIGDAVAEDAVLVLELFDGVLDGSRGHVEKGKGK